MLVITSLGCGGAERVMTIMANYWAAKGWEITLLTFDDGTVPPFYDLHVSIVRQPLGIAGDSGNAIAALWNNGWRIRRLRAAIAARQPNAVISFTDKTNILTLCAVRLPNCLPNRIVSSTASRLQNLPIIVSERTDPSMHNIGKIWTFLRQKTYPWADRVVTQTQAALTYFASEIQVKGCVIPNPVLSPPDPSLNISQTSENRSPSAIAMGRLGPEKRYDLLLKAFARLQDRHPTWKLTVIGEGALRLELEILRDRLGLADRVQFPGAVKDPYTVFKQADLFVMSSQFEGFPNALCEAMACGLPVISTDCPSGPRAIIRDGIDGLLVPNGDEAALTVAMDRLMSDEGKRRRLAARAAEIVERFSLEKIMGEWESMLEETLKERA